MDVEIAKFILSEVGQATLERLAQSPAGLGQAQHLATLSRLRKDFTSPQAAGLLEVAVARQKATQQGKFSRASQMFFTRSGLEQASGEAITRHRATRLQRVLPMASPVADLGCGIGGDSLGLAEHFRVTGIDLDQARLLFAEANAAVYGFSDNFQTRQLDITNFEPTGYAALFFDPARRTEEGRRIFSVEDYAPPLSIIEKWLKLVPNLGVKISPGVNYSELAAYNCEVEIISQNGDVKEAVLWFGELRDPNVTRRATLLPQNVTLTNQPDKPPVEITEPAGWLYEPDGAVIRAGLVEELALQLGATKIDPDIAYLTAPVRQATPFARAYPVIESHPFNLKKLQRRLTELNVGRTVIKKRGSPLEPDALGRSLKLKGEREMVLVLTHVMGTHTVILCEPEQRS